MKVIIMCVDAALDFSRKPRPDVHMISIRNSNDAVEMYQVMQGDPDKFKGLLALRMDDIREKEYGYLLPKHKQVEHAINFVANAEKLVVHCTAGVSRSSAIAYVCACSRMPLAEALAVVDPVLHWPNSLIVDMGAHILGRPEICEHLKDKMDDKSDGSYSKGWKGRISNADE